MENSEEIITMLQDLKTQIDELTIRIDTLEHKLMQKQLLELTSRLDEIRSLTFSENILHVKVDENRENLFKHILYIYFYGDSGMNFHHWCCEISNFVKTILASRIKKGGKNPTKNKALKEILSNTFLLESGLPAMLDSIFEKEGTVDSAKYDGKYKELKDFVVSYLTRIFSLDIINTENLEELFESYK